MNAAFSKRKCCHPCSAPQTGGSCIQSVFDIVTTVKNGLSQYMIFRDPWIWVCAIIAQRADCCCIYFPNTMHNISVCTGSKQYHVSNPQRVLQSCNGNRILSAPNQRPPTVALQADRNRRRRALCGQCTPFGDPDGTDLSAICHISSPPKVTNFCA